MASVNEAIAKTTAASRSPLGVLSSRATTRTGTSRMRSTVRTLGTLIGNTAANGNRCGDARRPVAVDNRVREAVPEVAGGRRGRPAAAARTASPGGDVRGHPQAVEPDVGAPVVSDVEEPVDAAPGARAGV